MNPGRRRVSGTIHKPRVVLYEPLALLYIHCLPVYYSPRQLRREMLYLAGNPGPVVVTSPACSEDIYLWEKNHLTSAIVWQSSPKKTRDTDYDARPTLRTNSDNDSLRRQTLLVFLAKDIGRILNSVSTSFDDKGNVCRPSAKIQRFKRFPDPLAVPTSI
ncbi:hypothetical protein BDZ97DRAFT_329246 [Flammula alnicola]|nr:hypothetical protein BDZ97DRAFT_329246 [Flammula alnicola]